MLILSHCNKSCSFSLTKPCAIDCGWCQASLTQMQENVWLVVLKRKCDAEWQRHGCSEHFNVQMNVYVISSSSTRVCISIQLLWGAFERIIIAWMANGMHLKLWLCVDFRTYNNVVIPQPSDTKQWTIRMIKRRKHIHDSICLRSHAFTHFMSATSLHPRHVIRAQ